MALPNEIHPLALGTSSSYKISRSLRFNSADSAYLNRTPASAGNRRTWTWSGWVKRCGLNNINLGPLFNASLGGGSNYWLVFNSSNQLEYYEDISNVVQLTLRTTPIYRDPSAWYHVVLSVDTTQSTAANRVRIYVNGVEVTSFATNTYPAQNYQSHVNNTTSHGIGGFTIINYYFNGYMTEINFIDGQALTPSDFGKTDPTTGVWVPKKYAGTYGTNGFYLNFSDNSGTTSGTLGKDSSGNSNDWTPNNFSVTAGAGNDSLVDTPTNNFCVLSPVDRGTTNMVMANGNLDFTKSGVNFGPARGTIAVTSGKWYFEMTAGGGGIKQVGVVNDYNITQSAGDNSVASGGIGAMWDNRGYLYRTGTNAITGNYNAVTNIYTTNDVVMIAFDAVSGQIWFGKNGTWNDSGNPASGTTPAFTASGYQMLTPMVNGESSGAGVMNFGQRPFTYTPPTGFKALNTQNLPVPTIKKPNQFFNAVTWTGTGATRSITGVGFQPDLVWSKSRSNAETHKLVDAVRGATKALSSETTGDEVTESGITSFNSDGFTIDGATDTGYNTNTYTYVGWNWKKGVTPGFDIVTYTGNGSARTISHSLGAVPHFMIVKARTTASTDQGWPVYHRNNTAAPETDYLLLNSNAATADLNTVWNDTAPTSSVFSVGTNALVNANNDTYVAYLWTEIPGFSRFGSYTGNGSADGPFVFCGFRPRFIMWKFITSTGYFDILDTTRSTYNPDPGTSLQSGTTNAESNLGGNYGMDILSNGFKLRGTNSEMNQTTGGGTYIFAAFAETPFKNALAR